MIDTTLLEKAIINSYEGMWKILLFILIVGIVLFKFRNEISNTNRERTKVLNAVAGMIFMPILFTAGYILAKGYLLWLIVAGILSSAIYLSYLFGLFDELIH